MEEIKERFFNNDGILIFLFCFCTLAVMFIIAFGFYSSLDTKVSKNINNLQNQLKQTTYQVDSLNTEIKKILINKKDTVLIQVYPQKIEIHSK